MSDHARTSDTSGNTAPESVDSKPFRLRHEPWVKFQQSLDAMLDPVGEAALARLAPKRGEVVLDVGCGCGTTTFALAEMVGSTGTVIGVDISAPMLEVARSEALARGTTNVEFVLGDAGTHPFSPDHFDVIYSRLGTMFFDEPGAAFANLNRILRPGGRFGSVVWRTLAENQWSNAPRNAVTSIFPALEQPLDRPGPFSLGDRPTLSATLKEAGFVDVDIEPHDEPLLVGQGDMDTAIRFYLELLPSGYLMVEADRRQADRMKALLRTELERHQSDNGIWMGSATWIALAR